MNKKISSISQTSFFSQRFIYYPRFTSLVFAFFSICTLIFLTNCSKKEEQTKVQKENEVIIIDSDTESIEADGLDKATISLKRKDSKGIVVGIGASFVLKTRDGSLEYADCERVGDRKECTLSLIVGVSPA